MMFKDGVWIPAQPMAFYQDTRPWFVRLWHAFLVARGCDEDELLEPWYVPVPPGTKTDRMRG